MLMSGQLLLLKLNRYTCETCFRVLLIYNITGDKKGVCCKYYVGNAFLEDLTYFVIILLTRNLNQQLILNRIFFGNQIAEQSKAIAEEKQVEVDILGRSVEELESTVYALESQVCALSEIQLFPLAFSIFHEASIEMCNLSGH
jgi:hypothetical protein